MAKAETLEALNAKAALQRRNDFDLHVLLVCRQDKVNKSKALVTAYHEGTAGLEKRLTT